MNSGYRCSAFMYQMFNSGNGTPTISYNCTGLIVNTYIHGFQIVFEYFEYSEDFHKEGVQYCLDEFCYSEKEWF